MARIGKILEKNGKKLFISQFLPDEIKEKDKDGNYKEDYITIKKLPYEIKTKIKYLSMKSFSGVTQKEILKKFKESGYNYNDLQNLNTGDNKEVMDFMLDIDFANIETEDMAKSTLKVEKFILEYGIDPDKHSFKDGNKKIELNYETLNAIGNEKLIKYIIDNIKVYSEGFILGK
jgi:hypothetical protein